MSESDQSGGLWRVVRDIFSRRQTISLRESLEEAIEDHEEEPGDLSLSEGERTMLFNILNYGELRVDDVMVPRADIVALRLDTALPDVLKIMAEEAHSRLPLYRDELDEIVGMIHVKDIIRIIAGGDSEQGFSLSNLQRPVLFVPPSMRIRDLLAKMRARRTHMAIVVDEYGGTDGLVTFEDLVEEIIGEIEDEHDDEEGSEPALQPLELGGYDADARVEIEELEKETGIAFLAPDREEDVDTLGGLVFSLTGRVPEIGEMVFHESGYRFEVLDADPRRIRKIRIYPPRDPEIREAPPS